MGDTFLSFVLSMNNMRKLSITLMADHSDTSLGLLSSHALPSGSKSTKDKSVYQLRACGPGGRKGKWQDAEVGQVWSTR